jgi:uncharacterized protein YukJ
MPIPDYGVLKAHPTESIKGTPQSHHYQIHVIDQQSINYRIAVNVLSDVTPYNLLYHVDEDFTYSTTPALLKLPDGFTQLASQAGGLAIDFVRSNIVDAAQMQPLHFTDIGSETQLNDLVDTHVQEAISDPDARVYAFGSRWGPENGKPDENFGFEPGDGIHNIHMNQGNSGSLAHEDGVWQDGALLIYIPSKNNWSAVFLKFQSQSWQTDNTTGDPL